MAPTPIRGVDAFTEAAFRGNPAAVCLLDEPRDEAWMQAVAAEINLSETAFLWPEADGFRLRWFTPTVEVDLCGHATLASAHVLRQEGRVASAGPIRFHTRSGTLTTLAAGEAVEMDFPAVPAAEAPAPPELRDALGVAARFVGRSAFDYLVEVADEAAVRGLRPDLAGLRKLGTRGVIVTARSHDPSYDFVSRFFAPGAGVDEDPVTGSAHCTLAPFWGDRLGKARMIGHQVSRRGGAVHVEVRGDRVALIGRAVTVWRGELLV
jgi:PhzF family phenazine biosynthesis protein